MKIIQGALTYANAPQFLIHCLKNVALTQETNPSFKEWVQSYISSVPQHLKQNLKTLEIICLIKMCP